MKKLRKKVMPDKRSTSGTRRRDVVDPTVSRGAERSEATTSSATNQLVNEARHAADKEAILGIPDSSSNDELAMLSATEQKLCDDFTKLLSCEGIKLLPQSDAGKPTSEGIGELKDERKEQIKKDVEYFLERAKLLANTRTRLKFVFMALHEAFVQAVVLLSNSEALRVLEASGEILYNFLRDMEFTSLPSVEVSEKHLKAVKVFHAYAKEFETSHPKRSAKMEVRFYLCAAVYQNQVQWQEHAQHCVEKAKKILQKHFEGNYKSMTLFGQICFLKAPQFYSFRHHEALDSCLKQSFNAFSRRLAVKTPSNIAISNLYSLPLDAYNSRPRLLMVDFSKHVLSNLEARSRQFVLTPSEKILNLASRVWISCEIGNIRTNTFKRNQEALTKVDLSIPPPELIKPMTDVLLILADSILLPNNIEFKTRLLCFIKDLCFLSKNLYIKFKGLQKLVLATINQEDFYKENNLYLGLCTCFTKEMENETLYPDCYWMHEILSSSHLHLCYILAEAGAYDDCLEHANRAIEVTSGYKGEYKVDLEYLRARAHYICAFTYYKKKDHNQAKMYFDREIALLKEIQPHYPESLHAANTHKAFLESGDTTKLVPNGLRKMFMEPPEWD